MSLSLPGVATTASFGAVGAAKNASSAASSLRHGVKCGTGTVPIASKASAREPHPGLGTAATTLSWPCRRQQTRSFRTSARCHDRQLLLDLLRTLPSQREARQFLKRFGQEPHPPRPGHGVNGKDGKAAAAGDRTEGNGLGPAKAKENLQEKLQESRTDPSSSKPPWRPPPASSLNDAILSPITPHRTIAQEILTPHQQQQLGLICLQAMLPDSQLRRFAATLVHLQKLGLMPIVLLEEPDGLAMTSHKDDDGWGHGVTLKDAESARKRLLREVFRVVDHVDAAGGRSMALYSGVFDSVKDVVDSDTGSPSPSVTPVFTAEIPGTDSLPSSTSPTNPEPSPAQTSIDLTPIHVSLNLHQIPILTSLGYNPETSTTAILPARQALVALAKALTSDPHLRSPLKAILLNDRGGLTNPIDAETHRTGRPRKPFHHDDDEHPLTFINLADEYEPVRDALLKRTNGDLSHPSAHHSFRRRRRHVSLRDDDDDELDASRRTAALRAHDQETGRRQLQDLDTVHHVLRVLPTSSSAIIAAAASSTSLIANLITDKPVTVVASDPPQSQSHTQNTITPTPPTPPTLLRHGLNVSFHPTLTTLNRTKLNTLLEASFRKRLLQDIYWPRTEHYIHGVIVAGDYDGAAIVTAEVIPGPSHGGARYAYLDKFAVAPTAQGIGVADILWKQLRRRYPDLCWRSRRENPVNRWYFERAEGHWVLRGGGAGRAASEDGDAGHQKLKQQQEWTLFWYGPQALERLEAYRLIAAHMPASFASGK
ncbi:uncharacterized protein EV422DRAFT_547638 [Fimicolochytrium jonesii]|uniref:uncharacterized protein n=1 Tax=Fimicolochytrium jonesii TaxID=1396493 RepID=UPI0022FE0F47|nr:uncharacterized protein EV422DRAFT_547638 [Fimicolochytrium jonesii]KAI8815924.1 hypothetical protein EV422DRAFT_547638 [Fimicolochytrium jonesii]